MYKYNHFIDS